MSRNEANTIGGLEVCAKGADHDERLVKPDQTDDMLEEDTGMIADKMWQASQRNHTKKENVSKDLEDLFVAVEHKRLEEIQEILFFLPRRTTTRERERGRSHRHRKGRALVVLSSG